MATPTKEFMDLMKTFVPKDEAISKTELLNGSKISHVVVDELRSIPTLAMTPDNTVWFSSEEPPTRAEFERLHQRLNQLEAENRSLTHGERHAAELLGEMLQIVKSLESRVSELEELNKIAVAAADPNWGEF